MIKQTTELEEILKQGDLANKQRHNNVKSWSGLSALTQMKTELEIRGGRVLIILKLAELTEESSR
jgi:hypothetical protein